MISSPDPLAPGTVCAIDIEGVINIETSANALVADKLDSLFLLDIACSHVLFLEIDANITPRILWYWEYLNDFVQIVYN